MHAFNRILLVLLALITLAFGIISLLLLFGSIRPSAVSPGGVLYAQWRFFTTLHGSDATTALIVSAVLIIVALLVLIAELLLWKREPARYIVRQDGLGRVTVARSSVHALVRHEAASVPDVMEVDPQVTGGSKGLHVYTRASVAPDADAPAVGQQLQARIQEAIQQHIGIPVADVQVATQIEPLNTRRRTPRVR